MFWTRKETFTFRHWALLLVTLSYAAISQGQASVNPPLAKIPMPPMAWSSWNAFSNTINSKVAMEQAKALASSGLHKAGYEYVNIDEGWWLGNRDAEGNIVVEAQSWPAIAPGDKPGDMSNIVRYIHSLGLKAGIYTDAGSDGCSMYPDLGPAYSHVGSEGHYEQDFLQFAVWGFDFVKVDWCGGDKENLSASVQYGEIARAISRAEEKTGRRLYFSICNGGKQSPWTWGPGIGGSDQSIWRVSDDIVAPVVANSPNAGRKVAFEKMLRNFDQGIHPEAQHTGYYNDPDMMVVGMPGLNAEQNRLHLALWAISGAPLILGADLTSLDAETLATVENPEVIAIDQDPLGLQGFKVKDLSFGLEVWSKFLKEKGSRAVLLLNRSYFPAPMSVAWKDLGLIGEESSVRDVWRGKDLGTMHGEFKATVPAQDGLLLIIRGQAGDLVHYSATAEEDAAKKSHLTSETVFTNIAAGSSSFSQIRISYTNTGERTAITSLFVNNETGTKVALPPTGQASGSVWIQAKLNQPGKTNTMRFTAAKDPSLRIDSIDIEPAGMH